MVLVVVAAVFSFPDATDIPGVDLLTNSGPPWDMFVTNERLVPICPENDLASLSVVPAPSAPASPHLLSYA